MGSDGSGSTGSEDGAGSDNAIGPVDGSETVALAAQGSSGMATLVANSTRSGPWVLPSKLWVRWVQRVLGRMGAVRQVLDQIRQHTSQQDLASGFPSSP